jgi:alpha-tubulin suppressor-like RCC1 family protein
MCLSPIQPKQPELLVATGLSFTDLTVGQASHICGLTSAGQAYCWGAGPFLGTGSTENTSTTTPLPVAGGLTFTSLGAGPGLTCGAASTGTAYCWGRNQLGELGNGDTTVRFAAAPVLVAGGLAFQQVTVGTEHACGLTTSGAAYCWGRNVSGELGTTSSEICVPQEATSEAAGFVPCSSTPLAVSGGLTFQSIAGGEVRTCGLTMDGTAYCWPGMNGENGPTALIGSIHLSTLSVGGRHVCGLGDDGIVYCWGSNDVGQLGAPGEHNGPVAVAGQQ